MVDKRIEITSGCVHWLGVIAGAVYELVRW
jgi:hypothetical protein